MELYAVTLRSFRRPPFSGTTGENSETIGVIPMELDWGPLENTYRAPQKPRMRSEVWKRQGEPRGTTQGEAGRPRETLRNPEWEARGSYEKAQRGPIGEGKQDHDAQRESPAGPIRGGTLGNHKKEPFWSAMLNGGGNGEAANTRQTMATMTTMVTMTTVMTTRLPKRSAPKRRPRTGARESGS